MNLYDKFKDKYRIETTRVSWHSYQDGLYFVTICVKNGACALGAIRDGEISLSDLGNKAKSCIEEIPLHYPSIIVDAYVVMPNHVHLILAVNDSKDSQRYIGEEWKDRRHEHYSDLAKAIGGLKATVKRYANELGICFNWLSRYHDHIIRSSEEYSRIDYYIKNNVARWADDCYHRR